MKLYIVTLENKAGSKVVEYLQARSQEEALTLAANISHKGYQVAEVREA